MKKVILVGPSLSVMGGVSTHIEQLLHSSIASDFTIIHFTVGALATGESLLLKCVRSLYRLFAFASKIAREKPDIVHLNTSMDAKAFWRDLSLLLICKCMYTKTVYQIHGGELPFDFFSNEFARFIFKRLLQLPDAVVVLAKIERDAYRTFADIKHLEIIPNAVDVEQYANGHSKDFFSKPTRLAFLGRIIRGKGIFEAIEAVHILKNEMRLADFHLTIAGSGPDELPARKLAERLGLHEEVVFSGPISGQAKKEFWRAAHLLVFPTFREGLPYTVLESLASGTPVVTTKVGGIPDVIKADVHGVFVPPGNSRAIAGAVRSLLLDPPRLKAMSANCLNRAKAFYSVERLAGQVAALYRGVCES